MRIGCVAAVALLGLAMPVVAQAQDYSEDEIERAIDFSMGDSIYTMYHEIGHLLVNELGLPVLGKEEDAADTLAVLTLLDADTNEDSYMSLIDAADGWYFKAVRYTGSGVEDFSFYSEHSLSIQRAYNMVCLMVGKDPDYFSANADFYDIDQEQRDACADTYGSAAAAWAQVLEPYLITDEPGADIEIIYEDPGDYAYVEEALKERQLIEHAAEMVTSTYVLPRPIIFRVTQCGVANAYYSHSGEIIYCYEMGDEMTRLFLEDGSQYYGDGDDEASAEEEEE